MGLLEVFATAFVAGFGVGLGLALASYILPVTSKREITYDNLDK